MQRREFQIGTDAAMLDLGARLAAGVGRVRLVYLHGPLGAGKTTLVRGMLRGLGYAGAVKSPTFTLVEPYAFDGTMFYHIDLYRMEDPRELEFIGLRDYLARPGVCVVEWAERARDLLPAPDIDVMIAAANTGRRVQLVAHTEHGAALIGGLA